MIGLLILMLRGNLASLHPHFACPHQNKLTTRVNSAHFEKFRSNKAELAMGNEFPSDSPKDLNVNAHQFTKIEYLYRDYGNWKFWGEFWLSGFITHDDMKPYLLDEGLFVPRELGISSLTPKKINEDDHWLHEVIEVTHNQRLKKGAFIMPSEIFLSRLKTAHAKGWYNLCPWV